jgi:UDP-N-acetylglucosamine acyltransferase
VISEQAMIDPSARLAEGVTVGPGTIIGADVEIGENTWIGPHVVIQGPTRIGKNNKIFQFSSVGDEPQDITYQGEPTRLEMGDNNVVREFCLISRGTVAGGGVTRIGNHCLFLAYSHVGHDCTLGDHISMVSYSALSGHVMVEDYATIGAYSAVHQFCRVGAYAFITRGTYVTKDVVPYVIIAGQDTTVYGINVVGLKRRGFSSDAIDALRRAYKVVFRKGLTVQNAITDLEAMISDFPEVSLMIESLTQSKRGILR